MAGQNGQKRTRVSRSRAQWLALVEQFEASGLWRSQFCRNNGIAPSSFNKAWTRLRGPQASDSAPPAPPASPFVELSLPDEGPSPAPEPMWDVELQLSAETVIRLRRVGC